MIIVLWIAQGLLAAMCLIVGSLKVFQPAKMRENRRMTWAHGHFSPGTAASKNLGECLKY